MKSTDFLITGQNENIPSGNEVFKIPDEQVEVLHPEILNQIPIITLNS